MRAATRVTVLKHKTAGSLLLDSDEEGPVDVANEATEVLKSIGSIPFDDITPIDPSLCIKLYLSPSVLKLARRFFLVIGLRDIAFGMRRQIGLVEGGSTVGPWTLPFSVLAFTSTLVGVYFTEFHSSIDLGIYR